MIKYITKDIKHIQISFLSYKSNKSVISPNMQNISDLEKNKRKIDITIECHFLTNAYTVFRYDNPDGIVYNVKLKY